MEQNNNYLPVLIEPNVPSYDQDNLLDIPIQVDYKQSSTKSFIEANTIECSLDEIKDSHTIPVFLKDNEPLISHSDFIETTWNIVKEIFYGEHILKPSIRVSHPVKGRIPTAKHKQAIDLLVHEKTLFYERCMFVIEIPSIQAEVGGNLLNLTIGGVKSYSDDNLYQRSNGDQHFKIFIGFKNRVCTNLCVWSDGLKNEIAVKGLSGLMINIHSLIRNYNSSHHLYHLQRLSEYFITEQQFAHLVGKLRMYTFLPNNIKKTIPEMLLGDNQISAIVKDYYRDKSFSRNTDGNINLWRLYNLFTGSNKSTYINQFLDRSVNAYSFTENIRWVLEGKKESWYLN